MTTLSAMAWIIGVTLVTYAVAEASLAIWRDRGRSTHNNDGATNAQ